MENIKKYLDYILEEADRSFSSEGTFLIGSLARGDESEFSDIDILVVTEKRINSEEFRKKLNLPFEKNIISIIKYPVEKFKEHWSEGSLFSYHLKNEASWYRINEELKVWTMRNEFFLKEDFSLDIEAQILKIETFKASEIFEDSTLFFSAELFLILKNVAIFLLAHEGQIILNKWKAYEVLASRYKKQVERNKSDFKNLQNAYLHIYKYQFESLVAYSVSDFERLVSFTKEVALYARDQIR